MDMQNLIIGALLRRYQTTSKRPPPTELVEATLGEDTNTIHLTEWLFRFGF